MFRIFPGTFTKDGRKVPIKEAKGWKDIATSDKAKLDEWSKLYGHKINFWGVPTGSVNGILVLDVDVKNGGLDTIKKYHLPATMTQRTRSGGKHYIFKYPQDGNIYGNKVGFDSGLDVRGENGYIAYYGTDNTPIAEAPEWLLKQTVTIKKEVDLNNAASISKDILNSALDESCDNIRNAAPGESNNVLNIESYKIGQLVASNENDRNKAFNRLFEAAKDRGKPEYESTATINSGLKGGSETPVSCPFSNSKPVLNIPPLEVEVVGRWTPAFFNKNDLTNVSKLRKPQVFKDWSTEDIHITTADGGTGKTTLNLFESVCLALGEDFLGFKCRAPGRTLFITGEDTREKIGAMIGVILKQMKIIDDDEKVRKVMNSILVKKASDICLITKNKQGFITPNVDALNKVMEAVEDIRPKKIVFDPISSFWGSEAALNDMSKAVATFMGALVEKSDACVEVINHMGKVSSKDKDMTQFAGRGGTGLPSHARVSRVLRPIFEDEFEELTGMELEDNKSAMLCNVNKFSDGSPLYNKPFLIVREGYLFSRVTLIEQKIKEEQNKMSDNERIFTYVAEERRCARYPTKNIVIAEFMNCANKISKDRVSRSLDTLVYSGHMGDKLKMIENPDPEVRDRVYIITDKNGKEL